jgi:hypothetical protein
MALPGRVIASALPQLWLGWPVGWVGPSWAVIQGGVPAPFGPIAPEEVDVVVVVLMCPPVDIVLMCPPVEVIGVMVMCPPPPCPPAAAATVAAASRPSAPAQAPASLIE